MAQTLPSYCRATSALAGVQVTVDAGRIVALEGDRQNPLSAGHLDPLCQASVAQLDDPRRLRTPLRRGPGGLQPCSWDEALQGAAQGLAQAHKAGGPRAVGVYAGPDLAQNPLGAVRTAAFALGLGTPNLFSPLCMSAAGPVLVTELMTGSPLPLQADVGRSHYTVLLGLDPDAEGWGPLQMGSVHTQALLYFRKRRRENRLVTVGYRRTAMADRADEHLSIRPGTECFFLLGLAHSILFKSWTDEQYLRDYCKNLDRLRQWLEPWDVQRCGEICGVDPGDISGVGLKLSRAAMAVIALGPSAMEGRLASVTAWAWLVVHALTANLMRPGGLFDAKGLIDLHPIAATFPVAQAPRTRVSGLPSVLLQAPGTALAEEILTPGEGQVRALLSVAGCPLSELPDRGTLDRALDSLDCLVAVDWRESPTTRKAHWVLPSTHFWERPDLLLLNHSALPARFVQATPAIVPPVGEARPEADLLAGLFRGLGLGLRLQGDWGRHLQLLGRYLATTDLRGWTERVLDWASLPPLAELEALPHGLERGELDRAAWRVPFDDNRIDLAPEALGPAIEALSPPSGDPARPLRLVTSATAPGGLGRHLRAPDAQEPGITLHPSVGVAEGAAVVVETAHGRARGTAHLDERLHPLAVVVPWGWAVPAGDLVGGAGVDRLCGSPDQNGQACRVAPA